jgi:hypothetical protein
VKTTLEDTMAVRRADRRVTGVPGWLANSHHLLLAAVALLLAGVLAPAAAKADLQLPCFPPNLGSADATIAFDYCPSPGSVVTTQFSDGIDGVEFGTATSLGFPGTVCEPVAPTITATGPLSGARALAASFSAACNPGPFIAPNRRAPRTPGSASSAASAWTNGGILIKCSTECTLVTGWLSGGTQWTVHSFDVAGNTLTSAVYPLSGGYSQFSVGAVGPTDVAFVYLEGSGSLDDLHYVNDPAALPHWTLTGSSNAVTLHPDGTLDRTFHVARLNNSAGTITPSVSGLPAGVTATFNPSSFAGTTTGDTVLTIGTTLPPAPGVVATLSVGATADASAGLGNAATPLDLYITPTLAISSSAGVSLSRCTPATSGFTVHGPSTFTGVVDLSVSLTKPAGDATTAASVSPSQLTLTAGVAPVDVVPAITVDHGGDGYSFPQPTVHLTATIHSHPADHVSTDIVVSWLVSAVHPGAFVVQPPLNAAQPGSAPVIIYARGICSGDVTFGNEKTRTALPAPSGTMTDGSGPWNAYTIPVPRYATTGEIDVFEGGGTVAVPGPSVTVKGIRNTKGYPFANASFKPPWRTGTYDDYTRAFGEQQTYYFVDPCPWPTSCPVNIGQDPFARAYYYVFAGWSGHCYGMALSALQFWNGDSFTTSFPHSGGTDVFNLTSASMPSPALETLIDRDHLVQMGLQNQLGQSGGNTAGSLAAFVAQLQAQLVSSPAMLIMKGDSSGHAVVAYGLETNPDGSYDVDILDSNQPYTGAEQNADGVAHMAAVDGSRVHLTTAGWSFASLASKGYSGPWGTGGHKINLVPYAVANGTQWIPSANQPLHLAYALGVWLYIAFSGSASGGDSPVTATVPGASSITNDSTSNGSQAFLVKSPTATVTLRNVGAGAYQESMFGRGTLTTYGSTSVPGTTDVAHALPGGISLTTARAKALTITQLTKSATTLLSTGVATTSRAGSLTSLQVSKGLLSASSTGGGPLSFTTTSTPTKGAGAAQTLRFVVPLPAGDRLTLPISALSKPTGALKVTVVHRGKGHAVTVRAKAVAVAAVRPLALVATAAKARGTATARVAIRSVSRGTQGTLTVSVFSGRKRIATKAVTCRPCRVGTLAAAVRWAARRGTYSVTATLSFAQPGSLAGQVNRSATRKVVVK